MFSYLYRDFPKLVSGYFEKFGPFCDRLFLSHDFEYVIAASVPVLLFPSSPVTIFRCVVAFVVSAVDGVQRAITVTSGWARTHVCKKRFERLPLFADGNSTSAVSRKSYPIRIGAAVPHLSPYCIFRSGLSSSTRTVCEGDRSSVFAPYFHAVAPTRRRFSRLKNRTVDGVMVAAVASAEPVRSFVERCFSLKNDESSESLSCQIDEPHVGVGSVLLER